MADPDQEKPALGADLVLPGLAIAFALYFFYSVKDLIWEAKANATLVGVTLLALVALFIAQIGLRVWRGEATLGIEPLLAPRAVLGQRFLVVLLSALFIGLIPWLGLTLGLFLLCATLMLVLRAGSWRLVLTTSATIAVTAYLLFIALLNSRLPRGPVEKLLAAIF